MIRVIIYTPGELAQSSYVHTGFFELEEQKYLKCYVKLSFKRELGTLQVIKSRIEYSKRPNPKTSYYDIKIRKSKVIKIAIDLDDNPSRFSKYALKNCEYIFKRNFQNRYIDQLSIDYKKKIFPFGITSGCISNKRHGMMKIYLGLLIYLCSINIKIDNLFFSRLKTIFINFKNNYTFDKNNINIEKYRNINLGKKKEQVFYQTRCFKDDSDIETRSLHEYRNKLISQLKINLKDKFKGGFLKSNESLINYRNNISNLKSEDYYNEIANSQIAVYSNGLTTSPAWKLFEYLSRGNAIIAEKFQFELPYKLDDNKHLIYYNDPNDCGLKARKLIGNKEKIYFLSKNANDFFKKYVDPMQNIKRIINFIIEREKSSNS